MDGRHGGSEYAGMNHLAPRSTGKRFPPLPPTAAGSRIIDVFGNSMLPLYRHGDRLVVDDQAAINAGDRVVVETGGGRMLAGTLVHRDKACVIIAQGPAFKRDIHIDSHDLKVLSRVIWASQ